MQVYSTYLGCQEDSTLHWNSPFEPSLHEPVIHQRSGKTTQTLPSSGSAASAGPELGVSSETPVGSTPPGWKSAKWKNYSGASPIKSQPKQIAAAEKLNLFAWSPRNAEEHSPTSIPRFTQNEEMWLTLSSKLMLARSPTGTTPLGVAYSLAYTTGELALVEPSYPSRVRAWQTMLDNQTIALPVSSNKMGIL